MATWRVRTNLARLRSSSHLDRLSKLGVCEVEVLPRNLWEQKGPYRIPLFQSRADFLTPGDHLVDVEDPYAGIFTVTLWFYPECFGRQFSLNADYVRSLVISDLSTAPVLPLSGYKVIPSTYLVGGTLV